PASCSGVCLRPDPALMRSGLEAVKAPESPIEIRVINTRNDGPCRLFANTYNGFYDDVDAAVRDISRITGRDAAGVYMTINPLDDIVRNWGHNRLAKANKAADDNCVVRLCHLFIDIDPLRPSST